MSTFQTGRERSERMNETRSADNGDSQAQQPLNYSNPQRTPMYSTSYGGQQFPPMNNYSGAFASEPPSTGARADSYIHGENSVQLSTVVPGPAFPSETQLNVAYAYAIQRADGKYTRLLAADEIEAIDGIPPTQGPEGLIVLPTPRAASPRRRQNNDLLVSIDIINQLVTEQAYRARNDPVSTQMQIDSIVAQSAYTAKQNIPRRHKIYCDKWIHEGICSFTQLGCKYKHEMPHDKATQLSLGLNHGLPNWYRRAYCSPTVQMTLPGQGLATNTPTSPLDSLPQYLRPLEGSSSMNSSSSTSGFQADPSRPPISAHGPISPPHGHHTHPANSSGNVYADRSGRSGRSSHSSHSASFTSNPYPGYQQDSDETAKGWP